MIVVLAIFAILIAIVIIGFVTDKIEEVVIPVLTLVGSLLLLALVLYLLYVLLVKVLIYFFFLIPLL